MCFFRFSDDNGGDRVTERGWRLEQVVDLKAHRGDVREPAGGSHDAPRAPPEPYEAERRARAGQEQLREAGSQRAAAEGTRTSAEAEGACPAGNRCGSSEATWPPAEAARSVRSASSAEEEVFGKRPATWPSAEEGQDNDYNNGVGCSSGSARQLAEREGKAAEGEAGGIAGGLLSRGVGWVGLFRRVTLKSEKTGDDDVGV